MGKILAVASCVLVGMMLLAPIASAETEVERLLNLLVVKGVVTQDEAKTFKETIVKEQKDLPKTSSVTVPEWIERVKMGGDVRYRTRGDWGKTAQNQPQTTAPTNANDLRKQRIQQSIRGRFTIEGKVNSITYAGARFAGGNTNPRTTDDTIAGYFNKPFVMFDQYYMRFEAPKEMVDKYKCYFSDMKLWAGKFSNPFEYTELVWDTDINPGGLAFQYVSPGVDMGFLPALNAYSNIGMLWVDESANINTDPILWAFQAGVKTESFGAMGSTVNLSATIYDFANLQGKTPNANSAGTNSRTWIGDYGYGINPSSLGTYKYEYNVFDLLLSIDNQSIGDFKIPHGFMFDFIYNASVSDENLNKGAAIGGYIGKKKLKDPGDWKASAQWRYIQRDAVPDFMPDSNFYGFGTYTSAITVPNVNGLPAAGGTNGRGTKLMMEYQMAKNTVCNITYYWMEPIKSYDKRDPYEQLLFDVITKF
jgi:polyhydroxyalkanoate synthesis regulator phasin